MQNTIDIATEKKRKPENIFNMLGIGEELLNLLDLGFSMEEIHGIWLGHIKNLWLKAHPDRDKGGRLKNIIPILSQAEKLQNIDEFSSEIKNIAESYYFGKSEISSLKRDLKELRSLKTNLEAKNADLEHKNQKLDQYIKSNALEKYDYVKLLGHTRPKAKGEYSILESLKCISVSFQADLCDEINAIRKINFHGFKNLIQEHGLCTFVFKTQKGWLKSKMSHRNKSPYFPNEQELDKLTREVETAFNLILSSKYNIDSLTIYPRADIIKNAKTHHGVIIGSIIRPEKILNEFCDPRMKTLRPVIDDTQAVVGLSPVLKEGNVIMTNLFMDQAFPYNFEYRAIAHLERV